MTSDRRGQLFGHGHGAHDPWPRPWVTAIFASFHRLVISGGARIIDQWALTNEVVSVVNRFFLETCRMTISESGQTKTGLFQSWIRLLFFSPISDWTRLIRDRPTTHTWLYPYDRADFEYQAPSMILFFFGLLVSEIQKFESIATNILRDKSLKTRENQEKVLKTSSWYQEFFHQEKSPKTRSLLAQSRDLTAMVSSYFSEKILVARRFVD